MKLKLDENIDLRIISLLRLAGHDVATVPEQGLSSVPDVEVIDVCRREGRCLVTADRGFGNRLRKKRFPPRYRMGLVIKGDLFMGIEELLQDKREQILQIVAKHGACNVRVFGSVARGEADSESDIDFLIDLGENLSPWFPVRLIRDLENLLGRKVDVATENGLKERIKKRVLTEAVKLF